MFAKFEREILREPVRAGLADARRNGQRLGPICKRRAISALLMPARCSFRTLSAWSPAVSGRRTLRTDKIEPSGAVTFAAQHAQIGAPRTHGRPILVRHDSGDLVQVREVVSCPRRQQL